MDASIMYVISFLLLKNYLLVSCADSEDASPDLNFTQPTRAPVPTPTGLFKYVQMCENFCDGQFPPGITGAEAVKAVIGCHKGCYSFELFKVMGKKKSILILDKICSANCQKDFGAEEFAGKFCSLGCSRMSTLYRARVKELRLEFVEKLRHQENHEGDLSDDRLRMLDEEAEKYMKEHDEMAAEEIAVAVIVEHQKEHAVRFLKTGHLEHRRNLKKKIFHVERFAETPDFQQLVGIGLRKPFESGGAQKQDSDERSDMDDMAELESERKETVVMKLPSFPKHIETECLIFQIPIYVLTVFVFVIIAIGLWATYGDPADCLFCLSRKFWDKLEYMDPYSTDIDEDDVVVPDRVVAKHIKDMDLTKGEGDQDYMCPPPDKDAPPPYVEVIVGANEMKVEK